jgi:hypothetical protein
MTTFRPAEGVAVAIDYRDIEALAGEEHLPFEADQARWNRCPAHTSGHLQHSRRHVALVRIASGNRARVSRSPFPRN